MKNTTADCQKRLVKAVIQLYYVFGVFFHKKPLISLQFILAHTRLIMTMKKTLKF